MLLFLMNLSRNCILTQHVTRKEGMFLYSAVSSLLDCSKRFTLCPPPHPRQTCLFRQQLDFFRKLSRHAAITREDYTFTFPPLSIARSSFIQLSELGHQRRQKKCPNFETVAKGDSNPGSRLQVRHSATKPHRVPQ